MSEISAAIERLAAESGCDVLALQEFYLERLKARLDADTRQRVGRIRAAEVAAVEDCRNWLSDHTLTPTPIQDPCQ